ncbi:MAG: hypothetical protein QOD42_3757 [Sphingomonadales bacterium]|jgi:uncharacterized protein involved in exopolysaccharide biosynthesis|nr:hypothetical protein [Sphingomonadales bacterium]
MLNLASYNLPILGVALVIGVLTARWAFRRPPAPTADSRAEDSSQT